MPKPDDHKSASAVRAKLCRCCRRAAASSRLPNEYPNLRWMIDGLRNVLRGSYATSEVTQFVFASAVLASIGALIGLIGFARRDV